MPKTKPPPKTPPRGMGKRRNPPRHSFRPHGKPTKLTEEVWKTIIEKAKSGLPLKYCALAAGISADTLEMWRAQNEALEAELAEARAIAAEAAWRRIEAAGLPFEKRPGDWRSDAWRLERGFPTDFQAAKADVAINNNVTTNTALQITIVESREIESRTVAMDARIDELFNRRRTIRDIE